MEVGRLQLTVLPGSAAAAYLERVSSFLCERETENCVPLGIVVALQVEQRDAHLVLAESAGRVVGAAVLTPPGDLLLAAGSDDSFPVALVRELAQRGLALPGVHGSPDLAAAFADTWVGHQARAGRPPLTVSRVMATRIYRLRAVLPASGVPGSLRAAADADRSLLIDWLDAFSREALGETDRAMAEELADRFLRGPAWSRALWLWEVAGQAVSMAGIAGPTPHGIRVNAVFTPPEHRARGYASACVAALSQLQLDTGRQFCALFTDLANPTSNAIYRAIGYEPVADVDRYAFSVPT